jgi:CheY-like chemotaxis protein
MKSPLHILHLEDNPADAALIHSTLEAGGMQCAVTLVQNRVDFVAALQHGGFDLVLSDFSLPAFDGLSALKIAREMRPELPVILVSGTLGEERAIDSLKSGATDYVLKGHLSRLLPAVRRALQEAEERAERRRLQAQFIEAQKMEVIGHLAGGVAHDFNNIIFVIRGNSDLLASRLGPDSPLQNYTAEIRHATERAAGLTRQLLVFSRKQTVQPIVLDPNEVVHGLVKMLRRLIDENIAMTIDPGTLIGRVKADPGYIGQLLMNLAVNARDAMPGGGKLTIATSNARLDENDARAHAGVIPGDYVMFSVSDTGTGMTDEVKAHLFEPFFTTKPTGKGTGLGLATCQTIVQQSGGHMDVDSAVGKGTTFKVYLPRVREALETETLASQTGPLPRGTETLLVVEDEPTVRELAGLVLEAQGYEVLSASNGQEALQRAREHQGSPIRLVVTDVIMPLMGGKAMAGRLKTSDPNLKILFTSGYTGDAFPLDGALEPGVDFLPKPYSPETLVRKVRDMLDQPRASRPDAARKISGCASIPEVMRVQGTRKALQPAVPQKTAEDAPQTVEPAVAPLPGQTRPPRRILVVDDDISNRQLVTEMLVQSGYAADPAADGAAGWEALQARAYDLLITDNFMPKVTGLEMVKLLRGRSATLPVIMATGAIPTDELRRQPWINISAFLIKPYSVGRLLRTVKKVLREADRAAKVPQLLTCPESQNAKQQNSAN